MESCSAPAGTATLILLPLGRLILARHRPGLGLDGLDEKAFIFEHVLAPKLAPNYLEPSRIQRTNSDRKGSVFLDNRTRKNALIPASALYKTAALLLKLNS
jgi:hypothetical protein